MTHQELTVASDSDRLEGSNSIAITGSVLDANQQGLSSQELDPTANPGRFNCRIVLVMASDRLVVNQWIGSLFNQLVESSLDIQTLELAGIGSLFSWTFQVPRPLL